MQLKEAINSDSLITKEEQNKKILITLKDSRNTMKRL
jgi:hypothetical protein